MTVPKPPPFAADAANKAWQTLKRADGLPYQVFATPQFVNFTNWTRGQRDHLEALRLGVFGPTGLKQDVDAHGQAIIEMRADIQALQEAPAARPFP